MDLTHAAITFAAGLVAGGINAVAAGGTLLTFPLLVWLGLDSITANATSTVALWPFVVGGIFGYRREIATIERRWLAFAIPSIAGGFMGAALLRLTPSNVFDRIVPYLILFATLLFAAQDPIQRMLKAGNPDAHKSERWFAAAMVFQLGIGVYGGYFGAGIGIIMLAGFSVLGMTNIHQMNGLKNILAGTVNAVAALYFIFHNMVHWPDVGALAAGAMLGGYGGAGVARKLGQKFVRRVVIVVGFAMAASLFIKR